MQQHRYEEEDVEEILKRAVAIETLQGGRGRDQLLRAAEELGVSSESLEAAEALYHRERKEQEELKAFAAHQRRDFWGHFAAYLIVNAFLLGIDLFQGEGIQWAMWPIMGWGIGLAFHAMGTFLTKSSEFQEEFEKWKRSRDSVDDS